MKRLRVGGVTRRLRGPSLKSLFNSTIDGALVADPGTRKILLANEAAAVILGLASPKDMVGVDLLDYVAAEDKARMAVMMGGERLEDDPPGLVEVRAISKNGEEVRVAVRAVETVHEGKAARLFWLKDVTAQKTVERSLAETEEMQRQILDNANESIVITQDWKIVYVNNRCAEMAGLSKRDMLGLSFLDLTHPDDRPAAEERYRSILNGKLFPPAAVVRGFGGDGVIRWAEIREIPYSWNGKPAVMSMVNDITDRKRAEEALTASEERYRLLAENALDVIWVTDLNLKPSYISPSMTNLTGYSVEEALSGTVETRLTPASARIAAQAAQDALPRLIDKAGSIKDRTFELELKRKDGSSVWAETTVGFMRDSEGRAIGFVGTMRDISERKRTEKALRQSEERFRNLVETTSDWVWEVEKDGVFTYASQKVQKVLGYESDEILGKTIFDFMPAKEGRRVADIFHRFVARQQPFAFMEKICLHKDGHAVIMETSAVPFFGGDGALIGYRGIDRDITERKQVARRLQQSLQKLGSTMEETIQAISSTVEARDPYTTGHQRRVTQLACVIAKKMGLSANQISGIRVAGLLHDIGKVAVPTEILSKPSKLTAIEMAIIKTHPKVGHDILKNTDFQWPVAKTILQHHERLDGSGYPGGVRGEQILLEARILAVSDVVEAMSSHRPYRAALGIEKALDEIIRGNGGLYDPGVVRACLLAFSDDRFEFQETGQLAL